jgi:putative ABC transport system permease protein
MALWQYPTLWRYTAGEMRRRPGRTLLTLLGIVIGVAAVVAISVTNTTTHQAYRDMFESLAGRAALEVVAPGLGGFEERILTPGVTGSTLATLAGTPGPLLAAPLFLGDTGDNLSRQLEALPGVQAIHPAVQRPTALHGKNGNVPALAIGITRVSAADFTLREGRGLGSTDGVLLEASFARANGFELGKPVKIMTPTPTMFGPLVVELPLVGLLEARGLAIFNGGAIVVMPLATAQRLFGLQGQVTNLQVVVKEGANLRQVEEEIRRHLPAGLNVQPPAARGEMAQHSLMSTELALHALSMMSLIAGAFVILNAFLMNLGERRRQLAILRALGATRGQVTRLLLREAVILGVAGTLLGIGLGLVLSLSLRGVMAQLIGVSFPPMRLTATPFLSALVLGPGMALAATFVPARRAGRRAPLEDLLQKSKGRDEVVRRWPAYLGLILIAMMFLLCVAMVCDWLPPGLIQEVLTPGLSAGLVGCVLALPLVLSPLIRGAALCLKPFSGMEGLLAIRQLRRRPTRTSLTAGVLLIGVVVSVTFGQSLLNNIRDIDRWMRNTVTADFIVRGLMPDSTTTITSVALPEALYEPLAHLDPNIERVDKVYFLLSRAGDRQVVVIPRTFSAERDLPFALAQGTPQEVRAGLTRGEIVIGTALGQQLGLKVGDLISLETRRGPRPFRIAATATEYTAGGLVVYVDWDTGKKAFDIPAVHAFLIVARPGTTAEVGKRVQGFCRERGLFFQTYGELRASLDEMIAQVVGFCWGLLILIFVVASLGVVNTLTMNVLEQTRELGILRAIAMQRGQVRKLVLLQAVAIGLISLVPGVGVGLGLAWLMNLATQPVIGQPIPFHLDWWLVSGCFGVGLVIAVLAALVPAQRAARLQVIQALQYE